MAEPIPYVVSEQGGAGEAPDGSIPIALFGASGGGGGGSTAWVDITGKPSSFPPSAHTQAISTVTGLQTALNDLSDTMGSKASGADLDFVNEKADTALATANSAVQGLNGAVGLWIGTAAQLPAPGDQLPGVLYVTQG